METSSGVCRKVRRRAPAAMGPVSQPGAAGKPRRRACARGVCLVWTRVNGQFRSKRAGANCGRNTRAPREWRQTELVDIVHAQGVEPVSGACEGEQCKAAPAGTFPSAAGILQAESASRGTRTAVGSAGGEARRSSVERNGRGDRKNAH